MNIRYLTSIHSENAQVKILLNYKYLALILIRSNENGRLLKLLGGL